MEREKLVCFFLMLLYISLVSAETFGYNYLEPGSNLNPSVVGDTIINNYTINETEVVHNNLSGLQGGSAPDDFYHLTQALYDLIVANAIDWITSKWLTSSSEYLYNDTDYIYFNDTLLNETIADYTSNLTGGGGGTGIWTNDTDPELAEFEGNISIKNQISFTESNITIIVNETEFAIYI